MSSVLLTLRYTSAEPRRAVISNVHSGVIFSSVPSRAAFSSVPSRAAFSSAPSRAAFSSAPNRAVSSSAHSRAVSSSVPNRAGLSRQPTFRVSLLFQGILQHRVCLQAKKGRAAMTLLKAPMRRTTKLKKEQRERKLFKRIMYPQCAQIYGMKMFRQEEAAGVPASKRSRLSLSQ
ncbi:MAG: hypothetical protein BWY62_00659 [Firmicutes bacterium ADurb.Bin356]|nr:MAG: hypothetical protein BWY62_00659 [Firmicutes bacterium ADurb.Bin356]